MEQTFEKQIRHMAYLLAGQIDQKTMEYNSSYLHKLIHIRELQKSKNKNLSQYLVEFFYRLEVAFITFRDGGEANFIVFFDHDLNKISEVYLDE